MPMYTFVCDKCRVSKVVTRSMRESDETVICDCSEDMRRDFQADMFHVASDSYAVPIVSDSLAVSIDQIPEHRRLFPDIEVTKAGQPVFTGYSQHDTYLEKVGFVKSPQKKKRSFKKIASISK